MSFRNTNQQRVLCGCIFLGMVLSLPAVGRAESDGRRGGQTSKAAGIVFVDDGGRPIPALEIGSTLFVKAHALEAGRQYEFRLQLGDNRPRSRAQAVCFASTSADRDGAVRTFAMWYQTGVVDASCPENVGGQQGSGFFRSFDEAEETLQGKRLTVSAHLVGAEEAEPVAVGQLRLDAGQYPMVHPSNDEGTLENGMEAGRNGLYVSGRRFVAGESVAVWVVPNQHRWHVGDQLRDVTGEKGASKPTRAKADDHGGFHVRVWDRENQRPGAYDIIVQRLKGRVNLRGDVDPADIVSFMHEVGLILYTDHREETLSANVVGRPTEQGAGFQFTDAFDCGEQAVGMLMPLAPSERALKSRYAAFYVVNHRDVPEGNAGAKLTDVSGGIEIHPLKSGCAGTCEVPVWQPPLAAGRYDVVVDFGTGSQADGSFAPDGRYDEAVDFIDGAAQYGFLVADDPYTIGDNPVGRTDYSRDDYFPRLGGARDVDLRAVVRYPATKPGEDAPVAPGKHPLFVIQHGNHRVCEFAGFSHAKCPRRTPNHKGYMRLLELLASHGIIAVSIDAYDLSGRVPGWIAERGDLILRHLQLWSHLNDPQSHPEYPDFFQGKFHGHVDMDRISISGHSRGGEASVAAYVRNREFRIGSVSSIAPVDFEEYVLGDVPYFVILPAADGDVIDLSGSCIYDRAGGQSDFVAKSGIYVYGANHNFFNSVWARHGDDSHPVRDDYIPASQQQRLGDAYLAAFARMHLKGETQYEDMLRGRLVFPSTAGYKIFHFHHDKDHRKLERGAGDLATARNLHGVAGVKPPVHATDTLRVNWSAEGGELFYEVPRSQRDVTGFAAFCLRVAQTNALSNPTGGQGFTVELISGGKAKAVYVGRFDEIPQPYRHPYFRPPYRHNVLTTVRIPLLSFRLRGSQVVLTDIDSVRLRFTSPSQGELYVDDIEFSH